LVWVRAQLDLSDHPGPAGILVLRDLLAGTNDQGLASQLGRVFSAALGPVAALHALSVGSSLAAMTGAGLAACAIGGSTAAGVLLAATWSLTAGQSWLTGPGTLAWGLAWLGVGLTWWGASEGRRAVAALGAGLVVLALTTKATAAPALALLPLCVLFDRNRRTLLPLLIGLAVGAVVGGLLAPDGLPWFEGRGNVEPAAAVRSPHALAAWRLGERGMHQGALALATAGALAASLIRRSVTTSALLAFTLLLLAAIGVLRGDLLQPRHLITPALGLLLLVTCLPRPALWLPLLVPLAALDTLGFATAWQGQRADRIAVEGFTPPVPEVFVARHAALPQGVFGAASHELALQLAAAGESAPKRGVVTVQMQDRRQAHLHVGALLADRPTGTLTAAACCRHATDLRACAAAAVDQALAAGLRVVVPRRTNLDDAREQAFAQGVADALPVTGRARRKSLLKRDGGGDGALPCRGLDWVPDR